MPSDRRRLERETAEARANTLTSLNRSRTTQDRYTDMLNADREQRSNRGEPVFDRIGGSLDRFSRFDPAIDEYSQYGQGDTPGLEGGYSPEALAAMRAQAIESVPGRFDASAKQLQTQLLRRGGGSGAPIGGDYSRQFGQLFADRNMYRANTLRNVTMEDEKLKRENILANRQHQLAKRGIGLNALGLGANVNQGYNTAINQTAGTVGNFYNPSPFIGGQTSMAGTEADLNRTYGSQILPERPAGFWSQLGKSALGAGLNLGINYLTGGASSMFSRPGGGGYGPAGPPPGTGGYG